MREVVTIRSLIDGLKMLLGHLEEQVTTLGSRNDDAILFEHQADLMNRTTEHDDDPNNALAIERAANKKLEEENARLLSKIELMGVEATQATQRINHVVRDNLEVTDLLNRVTNTANDVLARIKAIREENTLLRGALASAGKPKVVVAPPDGLMADLGAELKKVMEKEKQAGLMAGWQEDVIRSARNFVDLHENYPGDTGREGPPK